MFLFTKRATDVRTSFATEDKLIDYILDVYSRETGERMAHKTRYYRYFLPTQLRGNGSVVFTHDDFQRKNIMMRPDGTFVIID